jgi:hypothetical protein
MGKSFLGFVNSDQHIIDTSLPAKNTPAYYIELNPNYVQGSTTPGIGNPLRIEVLDSSGVGTGVYHHTGLRYNLLLSGSGTGGTENALTDAVKRLAGSTGQEGPGRGILIGTGVTIANPVFNRDNTNKTFTAWMAPNGSPSGPFYPMTDISIQGEDPNNKPVIIHPSFGSALQEGFNSIKTQTDGLRFYDIEFAPNGRYSFEGFQQQDYGQIGAYDCIFDVVNGQNPVGSFGGFRVKSHIRMFEARLDVRNCTFTGCEEHCVYLSNVGVDEAKGENFFTSGTYIINCHGSGPNGRTFVQIVDRSDVSGSVTGGAILGGPPSGGKVVIQDCTADQMGGTGSSAITIAGHLGDIDIINVTITNSDAGAIVMWQDTPKGLNTLLGIKYAEESNTRITPGDPTGANPGNIAWPAVPPDNGNIGNVYIDKFTFTSKLSPSNPTTLCAITGCRSVTIGEFDIQGTRPVFWFHYRQGTFPSDWQGDGYFDNFANSVVFLSSKIGPGPLSQYSGFKGGSKIRFGQDDNPNQPGVNGDLTTAQIDALLDAAPGAYPPWNQNKDNSAG